MEFKSYRQFFENENPSLISQIPPQGRVVVTGENVEKLKDKILDAIKKADPSSKADFYPATGKIVGVMITSHLSDLSRALRRIDSTLKAEIKR